MFLEGVLPAKKVSKKNMSKLKVFIRTCIHHRLLTIDSVKLLAGHKKNILLSGRNFQNVQIFCEI